MPPNCIEFVGAIAGNGYGYKWHGGRMQYAHRLAFAKVHGPIPDGKLVLHKCDNPICVNVEHLFLGTHKDNTQDMISKGRYKCGHKLTSEQVHTIKIKIAMGYTKSSLANEYTVARSTIRKIETGETWRKIMPTLYNIRTLSTGRWAITKFDIDLNPEATYTLATDGASLTCDCPAGVRPSCRHRHMLPFFAQAGAIDAGMFYQYETQAWHMPFKARADDPEASASAAKAVSLSQPTPPSPTPADAAKSPPTPALRRPRL